MSQTTRITKQSKQRTTLTQDVAVEDMAITVIEGPHKGETIAFDQEVLWLGRGDWCHLVLQDDPEVSKEHCELRIQDGEIIVRDLGSSNGIFLNNTPIIEAYWEPGSLLQLGTSTLQLSTSERETTIKLVCVDSSLRLVGRSARMRRLFAQLSRLVDRAYPVVLYGETGTGKTTIARAIHEQSHRKDGPFVEVNCSAIAPNLLEAQFFGYEKGAFTGADKRHKGYFEQAHGGTLFLDEIGELSLQLQPKLLQVLESKRVRRLGSETEIDVDVRLLASTHQDLRQQTETGQFRQDLYYRLAVIEFTVPPLRERVEDIPLLLEWLLEQQPDAPDLLFTPAALRKLQQYNWPGNVRELRNTLNRTLALLDPNAWAQREALIDKDDIFLPGDEDEEDEGWLFSSSSPHIPAIDDLTARDSAALLSGLSLPPAVPLKEAMEVVERRLMIDALEQEAWSMNKTAERLGISRVWLYKRIKKHNIDKPKDT